MIQISELVKRNFGRRIVAASVAAATLACVTLVPGCGKSPAPPAAQVTNDSSPAATESENATSATDGTAKTAQAAPLQWNDFPFMTSADAVATVIQPAALSKSDALGSLLETLPTGDVDLPIPPSETEWVAIYASPLVENDGSFSGDATMVLKLNRPSSVYEIAESRFDTEQFEDVDADGLTYLRVTGLSEEAYESTADADGVESEVVQFNTAPNMAVYEYDEFTFVICEEGRLEFVLDRSDVESPLRSVVEDTNTSAPIFVAASFEDRPILTDALVSQASSVEENGILKTLASNAQSIVLTGDFDGQSLFQLSLTTAESAQAEAIENSVHASAKSAGEFLQQMKAFAAPETEALFVAGQKLVDGVAVSRDETSVVVSVENPGNLPELFSSLASLFGQEVAVNDAE